MDNEFLILIKRLKILRRSYISSKIFKLKRIESIANQGQCVIWNIKTKYYYL
jgi:hypothetical protein